MGAEATLGYNSFSEDGTSVQATITENDGEGEGTAARRERPGEAGW